MSKEFVITVIGPDRPGLVESLSQTISDHDGSWLEGRMASLAGQFAGILLASVPDKEAQAAQQALEALRAGGLKVVVEPSLSARPPGLYKTMKLELVGQDHPGIIRDISHALVSRKISFDELETARSSASMSGETLFHASARLVVPQAVADDELREALESLANELMVDITLEEGAGA